MENTFKKNFIWNMIGATLNSFNSMFFMIVITRINGTDEAGVFTLLFSVANLLFNIGIYAGRTFHVTDKTNKFTDTEYVIHRMITVVIMFGCAVVYCAWKSLDIYRIMLTLLLCGMKCIEAMAEIFYGVLQKHEELYKTGISLTIKAVISLVCLVLIDLLIHNIIIAFIIVDCICLLITIFYDFRNTRKYLPREYSMNKVFALFPAGFYAFAFYFLNVYLANAAKYALDGRVSSSEQAMFSIVLMPATLINLCAIYLLQPYMNRLGVLFAEKKAKEFRSLMRRIIVLIIGIGAIAFICATFLGVPVLNLVYSVDISNYLSSLQLIIVGATLIAIVTVLSTALITFRNTKIQFYIYIIVSGIILLSSGSLVDKFGTMGATYTYCISTVLQLLLYVFAYYKDVHAWESNIKSIDKGY